MTTDHHDHHAHTSSKTLSDREFLMQFKDTSLDPARFNHVGHLRLTWIYLTHHDLETAVYNVCTGIKAYAKSLGVVDQFHLTITNSLVKIMAKRLDAMASKDWQSFLDQNRDMVDDAISVLLQHFSRDLLFSEAARTTLVAPDIRPI